MPNRFDLVKMYWNYLDSRDFDKAGEFLDDEIIVNWPNTGEIFRGRDNFIETQKIYPGVWRIKIVRIIEYADEVISVVMIYSEESPLSFHAVSFFSFHNDKIMKITEYYGDNGAPPQWRIDSGLSEIHSAKI